MHLSYLVCLACQEAFNPLHPTHNDLPHKERAPAIHHIQTLSKSHPRPHPVEISPVVDKLPVNLSTNTWRKIDPNQRHLPPSVVRGGGSLGRRGLVVLMDFSKRPTMSETPLAVVLARDRAMKPMDLMRDLHPRMTRC